MSIKRVIEPSSESIVAARKWFADNALACAAAARSRSDILLDGEFHVNDIDSYKTNQYRLAQEYLEGEYDHTFAFLQKAYYLQTGIDVALLGSTTVLLPR